MLYFKDLYRSIFLQGFCIGNYGMGRAQIYADMILGWFIVHNILNFRSHAERGNVGVMLLVHHLNVHQIQFSSDYHPDWKSPLMLMYLFQ